jgi:flagellar hook-associated protein 3 FlgL
MRVTNNMITNQVGNNLEKSLNRFMKMQEMMSSSRRINTPSDDPIGTQKDLGYRKVLTEITQYKSNISSGLHIMSTYDNILDNLKNLTSSAYETAVSLSNDTYDETAREGAANEVESLFNQMLDLANTQLEGRYIYSGFRTRTKPFVQSANGIDYVGDGGSIEIEAEAGSKVGINQVGSALLFKQLSILGEDANLNVGINGNTLLADLHLGSGIDLTPGTFVVADNNLGLSATINISTAVDIDDAITLINNQLTAAGISSVTVDYGPDGNNLIWKTTNSGQITAGTLLSNLNQGQGIDQSVGKILIHDVTNAINVEVDLSDAANIGDIITEINNTLVANGVNNVSAAINVAGTGIDITDSNGTSLGLTVGEISTASSTASNLGLIGSINPVLEGTALSPRLDLEVSEAASGQTTATNLGLIGAFSADFSGMDLSPRMLGTTALSLLNNGQGLDLGQIKISQGRASAFLDLGSSAYTTVDDIINAINNCGLDLTASINSASTGIQIQPTTTTSTFIIEEVGTGRTAHQMGIFGSSDLMGSMMILIKALNSDDREVVGQLIKNLDSGMQDLLNQRASVGAKVNRLETTDSRLTDISYNFTELLSEVEDADLTKLVTDLAAQENSYNAALIAASKIIQPSLMDFLD